MHKNQTWNLVEVRMPRTQLSTTDSEELSLGKGRGYEPPAWVFFQSSLGNSDVQLLFRTRSLIQATLGSSLSLPEGLSNLSSYGMGTRRVMVAHTGHLPESLNHSP